MCVCVKRGERESKRARRVGGKLHVSLYIVYSHSDSEVESDVMAVIGQLSQLLAKQREEVDQLRAEQQSQFLTLHQKLEAMSGVLMDAQRSGLAEHAKEQRILMNNVY